MFPHHGFVAPSPAQNATPEELVAFVSRAVTTSRAHARRAFHEDCDKEWLSKCLSLIENVVEVLNRYEASLGPEWSAVDRARGAYFREQLGHHAQIFSDALAKPATQGHVFLALQAELGRRQLAAHHHQVWTFLVIHGAERGTVDGLADLWEHLTADDAPTEVSEPDSPYQDGGAYQEPDDDDEDAGEAWKRGVSG